jgi:hypothetical protein
MGHAKAEPAQLEAHLEFWRLRHKKFFAHFYHVFIKKIIKILYKSGKLDKFVLNKEYIVCWGWA